MPTLAALPFWPKGVAPGEQQHFAAPLSPATQLEKKPAGKGVKVPFAAGTTVLALGTLKCMLHCEATENGSTV
jgi:hypothetical protein